MNLPEQNFDLNVLSQLTETQEFHALKTGLRQPHAFRPASPLSRGADLGIFSAVTS